MKHFSWIIPGIICFCLALSIPVLGFTAESEDANRKALGELLTELEQKITDADKRMVAHPKFLDELRVLVENGNVYLDEGQWATSEDIDALEVPSISEVFLRRASLLDEKSLSVLEINNGRGATSAATIG